MNELVTVGGVCFVAVEPEKVNANNEANGAYGANGPERAQQAETRDERENAGTEVTGEAANGKRKYRARGERTRKEQRHAAWVKWYAKHKAERIAKSKEQRMSDPERYRAYQRKWREERKLKRLQRITD